MRYRRENGGASPNSRSQDSPLPASLQDRKGFAHCPRGTPCISGGLGNTSPVCFTFKTGEMSDLTQIQLLHCSESLKKAWVYSQVYVARVDREKGKKIICFDIQFPKWRQLSSLNRDYPEELIPYGSWIQSIGFPCNDKVYQRKTHTSSINAVLVKFPNNSPKKICQQYCYWVSGTTYCMFTNSKNTPHYCINSQSHLCLWKPCHSISPPSTCT